MDEMRLALGQFNEVTDEKLLFAKQLGVNDIQLNTPKLPGDKQWEFMDLLRLRTRIEDAGLRLIGLLLILFAHAGQTTREIPP